jgi:hypothetical protein
MKITIRTFVAVSAMLLVPILASPAAAEDFKLGIGGGATFTAGDYANAYKTGWHGMIRALWLPSSSVVGIRGAGYYGQNSPKGSDFAGVSVKNSALYGGDLNAAFRLTGKGAEGLYANAGIGVRAVHQEMDLGTFGKFSQTGTNISYNAGIGYSAGWFFAEANAVYFSVGGANLWSIPVTVGFQF